MIAIGRLSMRWLMAGVLASGTAMAALVAQAPTPCAPVGTPTCDPNGNPVPAPTPTPSPSPDPGDGSTALTVSAVTATVQLGGGRPVVGAEGVALDPATGFVYIGLNGNIISGCDGDGSVVGGRPSTPGAGASQLSIVNPATAREIAAVRTGSAPIWPTVDPNRRVVYMMGSGSPGTITVHGAADGSVVKTITVGGRPHMGGLDDSTGLMVVGNTVRSSDVVAEQNHATIVNMRTDAIVREFETSPAPHGVVVDQDRDVAYFSAVGDGAIVAVSASTGQVLYSGIPKLAYGTGFGGNNLLARQAATRRLFQVNTQAGATGLIVVDEITLAAVTVDPTRRIGVASNQGSPSQNATASILDLCPVYIATNRLVAGCAATSVERRRRAVAP